VASRSLLGALREGAVAGKCVAPGELLRQRNRIAIDSGASGGELAAICRFFSTFSGFPLYFRQFPR